MRAGNRLSALSKRPRHPTPGNDPADLPVAVIDCTTSLVFSVNTSSLHHPACYVGHLPTSGCRGWLIATHELSVIDVVPRLIVDRLWCGDDRNGLGQSDSSLATGGALHPLNFDGQSMPAFVSFLSLRVSFQKREQGNEKLIVQEMIAF
jgi:hypothetical protein